MDTKREDRLCQVCHSSKDMEDEQHFLCRSKFGPKRKSQAGLVRCREPCKNVTISEVVFAQIRQAMMQ